MRIAIFENPLPSDPVVTRATIFELACPKEFAVYRETTWWVLRQLATPFDDKGNTPRCLLKDYLQLKPFFEPNRTKVGLASTTKPCKYLSNIDISANGSRLRFQSSVIAPDVGPSNDFAMLT